MFVLMIDQFTLQQTADIVSGINRFKGYTSVTLM